MLYIIHYSYLTGNPYNLPMGLQQPPHLLNITVYALLEKNATMHYHALLILRMISNILTIQKYSSKF